MRNITFWLMGLFGLLLALPAGAHINPELHNKPTSNQDNDAAVSYREDCTVPQGQIDQGINRLTNGKVNNIRARLRTGGDVFWDGDDGKYIAPFVDAGQTEISSIFSGGVWLGGYDQGDNLKVACQTYGNPFGNTDFFTGPLDPADGTTDKEICDQWDRFFEVYGSEIDEHIRLFEESVNNNTPYTADMIPRGVKGWPAKGNEFFFDINEFELPNTSQGLAGFFDRDGDTNYEPLEGDYPVIEIRGCELPVYPDQMIFWIYNDAGGIHGETNGDQIKMEIQVQAFSYGTNDEINDMTFQRYKLINRATEDIDSTYFAWWLDADLGCYTDDYIGCDTTRSLGYTYNADAADGDVGCSCPGGVATYCNNVPIIGIDYFRGPLKPVTINGQDTTIEIGMSSFTYYNNGSVGNPDPGTTDPNIDIEYYRYLDGYWRDGNPFTYGDDAYQDGVEIDYAFTEAPNDQNGWSMCTADLPEFDRRTVQASGPFRLEPGAVNELIIGAVWVPDMPYPCPDITRLFLADDLAQNLFDNCFEITDGPDAPDVDLVELDQKLILVLTNDTITSNNAYELYEEPDLLAPDLEDIDTTYNFEGYIIYQLADAGVTRGEYNDPDKARIIQVVDLKNGIGDLYNWDPVADPGGTSSLWFPENQVEAQDEGLRHTFEVTEDLFATGSDTRLINHRKYYYSVVAYAHNNWEQYDPDTDVGQKNTFLAGRFNIKTYTAIPRPIVDRTLNADYGDGPIVTRLDGVGVGGNFVELTEGTRNAILDGSTGGELTYEGGAGPVNVNIYNPLEVVDGEFLLTFRDEDMSNSTLDDSVTWVLQNLSDPSQGEIYSDVTIDQLNEQIIADYGFTVTIGQTDDVGDNADDSNGAIGFNIEYDDPEKPFWLTAIPDDNGNSYLNYVATSNDEPFEDWDPNQSLSTFAPGLTPFQLCDHNDRPDGQEYVTPGWRNSNGGLYKNQDLLKAVNNIDIVFTSDKSKWSRCVVVETANRYYTTDLGLVTEGNASQFDLRARPSVGKDADADGMPKPDGSTDSDGDPRMGMGWFPGYAIDVETGKRLNIFFGENSSYDLSVFPEAYDDGRTTTLDMMFNPSSQLFLQTNTFTSVFNYIAGGQHFIYVSKTEYDQCEAIYDYLKSGTTIDKVFVMQDLTWAAWPLLAQGTQMLSYADGLVPNDLTVSVRVDNPYQVEKGTGDFDGYPAYRLLLDGSAPTELTDAENEVALDLINVVPNPYYGFSQYEESAFSTTVKITNLPAKCTVTIYSLDGKFIRQYNRDETEMMPAGNNRGVRSAQYLPDIDWDLKNSKGIPIAAGVYLIHVDAGEAGERVVKWFGTNRQFDPSGL